MVPIVYDWKFLRRSVDQNLRQKHNSLKPEIRKERKKERDNTIKFEKVFSIYGREGYNFCIVNKG